MKPVRTPKQREIMRLVLAAADRGEFLLLEELRAQMPVEMNDYNALRCSVQWLIRNKNLTRERAGNRSLLKPTPEAYHWFRTGG